MDREEVGQVLKKMGKVSDGEGLDKALAEIDEDGSGEVEYPEFLVWWRKQTSEVWTTVYAADGEQLLEWMKYQPRPGNFVATCAAARTVDRVWVYYTVPQEGQAAVEEDATLVQSLVVVQINL